MAVPKCPQVHWRQADLTPFDVVEQFAELALSLVESLRQRLDPVLVRPPKVLPVGRLVGGQALQLSGQVGH